MQIIFFQGTTMDLIKMNYTALHSTFYNDAFQFSAMHAIELIYRYTLKTWLNFSRPGKITRRNMKNLMLAIRHTKLNTGNNIYKVKF